MTIVDSPRQTPEVDMAQLLFEEARQRRRRRWLISGITILFILVALGITLIVMAGREGRGSVQPVAPAPRGQPVASSNANFSVRPVLCYTPPFAPTSGSGASTGPLPPCAPSSALTAGNLNITASGYNGYTFTTSPNDTDPKFAAYSSTSPKHDKANDTVLLPGSSSSSQTRYVLGPAGLTGSAIRSASVQRVNGQLVVNIDLNGHGATQLDNLSRAQFHAFIGIDLDGKVISAAIIQPTQGSFSSFGGQMQISDGLNRHQAEALAARL
jgi:hypothetical protein